MLIQLLTTRAESALTIAQRGPGGVWGLVAWTPSLGVLQGGPVARHDAVFALSTAAGCGLITGLFAARSVTLWRLASGRTA